MLRIARSHPITNNTFFVSDSGDYAIIVMHILYGSFVSQAGACVLAKHYGQKISMTFSFYRHVAF